MTPFVVLLLASAPPPSAPDALELPTEMSLSETAAGPREDALFPFPDPQVRRAPVSSNRVEMNLFLGAVVFDGDFESDPFASGGLMLRVPTPFLPTGRFALFGEFFVSKMERDLDPFFEDTEGVVLGGALGLDFSLYRSEEWFLLAQAGGVYITFGDIVETDDGFGVLVGAMAGLHPIRRDTRYALTINPQWAFDGDNWLLLIHAGLTLRF